MSAFKFRNDVINQWQRLWNTLCQMAYTREGIVEELCVYPSSNNEAAFYERNSCDNFEQLTLDYVWTEYSKKFHTVLEVPELKKIYVPRALFECLGVYKWFEYSFPNCEIKFW